MNKFIAYIFNDAPYLEIFLLSDLYFSMLYFGMGFLFRKICKILLQRGMLHKISHDEVKQNQVAFEIKNSLISILVFATSGIPIIFLYRQGYIHVLPNTLEYILLSLLLLNIWNEIHFFFIHRLLHHPFLMKKVHYIHHRSLIPTVYAVYSFHWIEATLLSTVQLTLLAFTPLSSLAIFIYPINSILFNLSAHCNHRFGAGQSNKWLAFATKHHKHHSERLKNYGFVTFILDQLNQNKSDHNAT